MHITNIIKDAQKRGTTRFAIELLPPLKGEGVENVFAAIEPLVELGLSYVDVTYHREDVKYVEKEGGLLEKRIVRRRPGTVGISGAIMRRFGIEVVPHIICGGMSRYDIEESLIDLDFMGIHNVLALRGDNLRGENSFRVHHEGHCYAAGLVGQISGMNNGILVDGEVDRGYETDFCIGVAGYPEKHAESPNKKEDIMRLKEKVDAGADYIVTQMSFDNSKILAFINDCRSAGINIPIVPGIKPFSTKAQLALLPQIFHVDLPDELVQAVNRCADNSEVREVGVEWAVAQSRELMRAGLPMLHFYTMGRTDNMVKIAQALF